MNEFQQLMNRNEALVRRCAKLERKLGRKAYWANHWRAKHEEASAPTPLLVDGQNVQFWSERAEEFSKTAHELRMKLRDCEAANTTLTQDLEARDRDIDEARAELKRVRDTLADTRRLNDTQASTIRAYRDRDNEERGELQADYEDLKRRMAWLAEYDSVARAQLVHHEDGDREPPRLPDPHADEQMHSALQEFNEALDQREGEV